MLFSEDFVAAFFLARISFAQAVRGGLTALLASLESSLRLWQRGSHPAKGKTGSDQGRYGDRVGFTHCVG